MNNQDKPLWRRIKEGELYSSKGKRRASPYRPPDGEYVIIKEGIPEATRQLFELCQAERLLAGIIDFEDYYNPSMSIYKQYIDDHALGWYEALDALEGYYYQMDNLEYEEYVNIYEPIYKDLTRLKMLIKRKASKSKFAKYGFEKGTARFSGKDVPKKIEEENEK